MPAQERLYSIGLRQADYIASGLGREARSLRMRAGLSQARLGEAVGVSRHWIADFELGRLRTVDLKKAAILFACLGNKLTAKAFPTGEPLRDAGQLRLLDRFNARVPPLWRRRFEVSMPIAGDLRAWDEVLHGPVSIGVEAETRPNDLQATQRAINAKQRDSHVHRTILLIAANDTNRRLVRGNIAALRQTFALDTRSTLVALLAGRDPGRPTAWSCCEAPVLAERMSAPGSQPCVHSSGWHEQAASRGLRARNVYWSRHIGRCMDRR